MFLPQKRIDSCVAATISYTLLLRGIRVKEQDLYKPLGNCSNTEIINFYKSIGWNAIHINRTAEQLKKFVKKGNVMSLISIRWEGNHCNLISGNQHNGLYQVLEPLSMNPNEWIHFDTLLEKCKNKKGTIPHNGIDMVDVFPSR